MQSFAIIGAGLAGATACRSLRDQGFEGKIFLFGDEPYEPYDRPSLSKSALATKSAPPLLMGCNWSEEFRVEKCLGVRVEAIDLPSMRIEVSSGSDLKFDKLLFATGSRARSLRLDAHSETPGLYSLRTLDDCVALQGAISPGVQVIIIGGGLIGCELATTIQKMGAKAIILETANELLLRVLGKTIGAWCREELEAIGVEVHTGVSITHVDLDPSFREVRCGDGRRFSGDLAIVSVGAEPVTDLAEHAGLACARGIIVNSVGMASSDTVYAAGDVASWPLRSGGRRSLETYLNSQNQAAVAAGAMLGKGEPTPQVPVSWTEIAGHRIQMMGDVTGPGNVVTRVDPGGTGMTVCRLNGGELQSTVSIDQSADFSFASKIIERRMLVDAESIRDPLIRMKDIFKLAAKTVA